MRQVHDFLTEGAAAPLQAAVVAGLEFPDSYYADLAGAYGQKRALFLSYLDKAGLAYYPPQGAYYVLVDISPFTEGTEIDDTAFSEWLTRRVGVAPVPGSSFFREPVHNYIRFHFAKKEETLIAAGERLQGIWDAWNADHG
jgi:aminotransferase